MKPFNLERALAGDTVCFRDGSPVLHVFYGDKLPKSRCVVVFAKNGYEQKYPESGRWEDDSYESQYDLFMVSEKKTFYQAVYGGKDIGIYTDAPHETQEEAVRHACSPNFIQIVSFEVEL